MRQSFWIVAAASVLGLATPAAGQERGAYVTVFGGMDAPVDEKIDGRNAAGDLRDIDVGFDSGSIFGAALGLASTERSYGRARAEIEFSHRESQLGDLTLNDVDRTVVDGSEVSVSAGMLNVFYDTPQMFDRLRFSVGAGFGAASVDHQIHYLIAVPPATGSIPGQVQIAIPTTEATYAWQLIGAAEIALTPSLSLTGDIRYFDLGDVQVERFVLNSFINGAPTTTGTLESILDADYATTSVTVGLRYRF
jgi:opacity protein-like surface antigen